jgi:hypothetical protein
MDHQVQDHRDIEAALALRSLAHGFEPEGFGVAVSAWEMTLLPKRFPAIMDKRLPERSRRFLAGLTFDERGLPLARPGVHAGVDACFSFRTA